MTQKLPSLKIKSGHVHISWVGQGGSYIKYYLRNRVGSGIWFTIFGNQVPYVVVLQYTYPLSTSAMLKLKLLFLVLVNWCVANVAFAQQSELLCFNGETSLNLPANFIVKEASVKKLSVAYPPASRDGRKLAINTCVFFGTSVLVFGVLSLCPEDVSGWKKDEIRIPNLVGRWSENVKAGPVVDEDNFFFNFVTHPYSGAVYYMTARSSGFKNYECFLYTTVMSTLFWEYGVEAFAEVPSRQDLLITPVVGSVFGEVFFNIKKVIMKHDKRILGSRLLGAATLLFMDPFNTILDGAGYKKKVNTQFNISPSTLNYGTNKTYLQLNLAAHF